MDLKRWQIIVANDKYLAFAAYLNNSLVSKNICIASLLGSLDVVKALNEYSKLYKALCILLISGGHSPRICWGQPITATAEILLVIPTFNNVVSAV